MSLGELFPQICCHAHTRARTQWDSVDHTASMNYLGWGIKMGPCFPRLHHDAPWCIIQKTNIAVCPKSWFVVHTICVPSPKSPMYFFQVTGYNEWYIVAWNGAALITQLTWPTWAEESKWAHVFYVCTMVPPSVIFRKQISQFARNLGLWCTLFVFPASKVPCNFFKWLVIMNDILWLEIHITTIFSHPCYFSSLYSLTVMQDNKCLEDLHSQWLAFNMSYICTFVIMMSM